MYALSVKSGFSAAHRLPGYAGDCARVHGHNWEVEACVHGAVPDKAGMLIDFRVLRRALDEILRELDHADLNSLPAFAQNPPTAEHIARHIFMRLAARIDRSVCRLGRVTVWETAGAAASYCEDEDS